jgi:hypothetical protein
MNLNSPGTILKLWTKVVKKHEEGKKPAEMPKKGQDQKLKIKQGLTFLKFEAPAAKANPGPFLGRRDKTATLLRKYCRYLKTSKDEDKKALPRFLKMVMSLAVVVQELDPGSLDLGEDEGGLEALDAVKTDALEEALNKPDTDAEVTDEPPRDEAGDGDLAALFKARWDKLSAAMLPVLKAKPANMAAVQQAAGDALKQSKVPAYPAALAALDRLEQEMAKAQGGGNGAAAAAAEPAAQWKQRSKALEPLLLAALKEKKGDVGKLRAVFAYAQEQAGNGEYAKAQQGLASLEKLLGEAAAPTKGPDLSAWQAARQDAIAQLRKIQGAVAGSKYRDIAAVVMALESIIKNLTPRPVTPQQVAELDAYVRTDDVITAAEEVPPRYGRLKIRKPLLDGLATLKV